MERKYNGSSLKDHVQDEQRKEKQKQTDGRGGRKDYYASCMHACMASENTADV
jgi:hypothetical protein